MKKAILILIVLILSFLYYVGLLTTKETLPFSKDFFSVETAPSDDRPIDLRMIGWPKPSETGRTGPTRKDLEQLHQLKLDRGVRNVPVLSLWLSREAEKAIGRGNQDEAIELSNYAIKLSPDLPEAYYGLARVLWSQSPFQVHRILGEVYRGHVAQFRHYPSSLKFFYNLSFILSNALLMTFVVFGVVLLAKYLPLYFYDLRRSSARSVRGLLWGSVRFVVLLVPFFLRLDLLWALMFWSIFLWGYVMKRERILLFVFLVLLVYLPFFLRSVSAWLDSPHSEILLQISQANHEDWDRGLRAKLEAWLSEHPADPEVLFTLGLIDKRAGRYPEAEEWYKKSLKQAPRFAEALSNLGNVYLAKRQIDQAIVAYLQAAELQPENGAYHYNLYRAYSLETFLSGKMSKAFEKARQLSPSLVDYYTSIDSPHINRQVIDEVLSARRLWNRAFEQLVGKEGVPYRLFVAWFSPLSARIYLLPIFFLGFLLGMSRYAQRRRFLNRCPMCGNPTFRFYMGASDQESICFNCHRIFVQKEKIHPRIKEKKSLQVSEFQKENHRFSQFLSYFFVGFWDLWRGRGLYGLLVLFVFFIFIFRFLYWEGALKLPFSQTSLVWVRGVFWGGLFIVFYFFSVRNLSRLKPRYEVER